MTEDLTPCRIVSDIDEDGATWPSLKPKLNETGYITKDTGLFYEIIYSDGETTFAPKECVDIL